MTPLADDFPMTVVVDIPCPDCGETKAIRKLGIAAYRCDECGCEFDQTDIDVGPEEP